MVAQRLSWQNPAPPGAADRGAACASQNPNYSRYTSTSVSYGNYAPGSYPGASVPPSPGYGGGRGGPAAANAGPNPEVPTLLRPPQPVPHVAAHKHVWPWVRSDSLCRLSLCLRSYAPCVCKLSSCTRDRGDSQGAAWVAEQTSKTSVGCGSHDRKLIAYLHTRTLPLQNDCDSRLSASSPSLWSDVMTIAAQTSTGMYEESYWKRVYCSEVAQAVFVVRCRYSRAVRRGRQWWLFRTVLWGPSLARAAR